MDTLTTLRTIARGDAELAALLPGGILDQPLTATGPMWAVDPVTGIKQLQPTAVALQPQSIDAPLGLNPGRRLDVWQEPDVYFYADRASLPTLYAADERLAELWHGQVIGTDEVEVTGYLAPPLDADELPGDIWQIYRRYRIRRSWHIQEG